MEKGKDIEGYKSRQPATQKFPVGFKYPSVSLGYLKIMAYVDGYYMVRYKGCIPFCCKEEQLIERMLDNN